MNFKLLGVFAILLFVVSHVSGEDVSKSEGSSNGSENSTENDASALSSPSEQEQTIGESPNLATQATEAPSTTSTQKPTTFRPATTKSPNSTAKSESSSNGSENITEKDASAPSSPTEQEQKNEKSPNLAKQAAEAPRITTNSSDPSTSEKTTSESGAGRYNCDILGTLTISLFLYAIQNWFQINQIWLFVNRKRLTFLFIIVNFWMKVNENWNTYVNQKQNEFQICKCFRNSFDAFFESIHQLPSNYKITSEPCIHFESISWLCINFNKKLNKNCISKWIICVFYVSLEYFNLISNEAFTWHISYFYQQINIRFMHLVLLFNNRSDGFFVCVFTWSSNRKCEQGD